MCAVGVEGVFGESALVSEELKPCGRWLAEELTAGMIGVFLPLLNLAFGSDVAGGGGAGRVGQGEYLPIDVGKNFLFSGTFFPSSGGPFLSNCESVQDVCFALYTEAKLLTRGFVGLPAFNFRGVIVSNLCPPYLGATRGIHGEHFIFDGEHFIFVGRWGEYDLVELELKAPSCS